MQTKEKRPRECTAEAFELLVFPNEPESPDEPPRLCAAADHSVNRIVRSLGTMSTLHVYALQRTFGTLLRE